MSLIWKRLQRVNKRAAKYRVIFSLQELEVEGSIQWQPNQLVVVLNRRKRRVAAQPMQWEPTIRNPYRGVVCWTLCEELHVDVTLYRGMRSQQYETKEWTLSIEDISLLGRSRKIATVDINISDYVDDQFAVPSRYEVEKKLNLTSKKVKDARIRFMLTTQFLKAGKATDYDMESVTSMMSVTATDGVQNLDDDDDLEIGESSMETNAQITEITNKLNKLLQNDDDDDDNLNDQTDHHNKETFHHLDLELEPENKVSSHADQQHTPVNGNKVHDTTVFTSNLPTSAYSECDPIDSVLSKASGQSSVLDKRTSRSTNDELQRNESKQKDASNSIINFKSDAEDYHMSHSRLGPHPDQTHQSASTAANRNELISSHQTGQLSLTETNAPVPMEFASCNSDGDNFFHDYSRPNLLASPLMQTPKLVWSTEEDNNKDRHKRVGVSAESSSLSTTKARVSPSSKFGVFDQTYTPNVSNPVQSTTEELLRWCQEVTKGYSGIKITNMTTSWRNGMAFCAIIHHFRPELIDYDSLQPSNIVANCNKAFDAAFRLGIPKIIEANDMIRLTVPDRLSVMTYLYQLKSFFTPSPGQGHLNDVHYNESEETFGGDLSNKEDWQQNAKFRELQSKCMKLFDCFDEPTIQEQSSTSPSEATKLGIKSGNIWEAATTLQLSTAFQQLNSSDYNENYSDNKKGNNSSVVSNSALKNIGHNDLSKRDTLFNQKFNESTECLMTRKQLMNPFDSDSDEDIEIISMSDSKFNRSELSTPSMSSNDSEDSSMKSGSRSKEPIRKPLKFASNFVSDRTLTQPTYQSTSFSTNCRLAKNFDDQTGGSVHSALFKMAAEPVEIAPGLLDLSAGKNSRLQRAFSVPTYASQHTPVDQRQKSQFRNEELRERARKLLESVRMEAKCQDSSSGYVQKEEEDERRRILRERARKMISDAKQGIIGPESLVSSSSRSTTSSNNTPLTSPSESSCNGLSNTVTGVATDLTEFVIKSDFDRKESDNLYVSPPRASSRMSSDVAASNASKAKLVEFNFYKFNHLAENNDNDNHSRNDKTSQAKERHQNITNRGNRQVLKSEYSDYPESFESLQQELDFIEKQQKQVDMEALILEKRLRKLMETGGNKRMEDQLMQNWFVLVNKRNALIRRQMQLNILEKEADMKNRYDELNHELRTLASMDEAVKTDAHQAREKQLLEDLLQIVDKRDELVRHLDNQEKAIEEDELVENATQGPFQLTDQSEKNCVIQ